MVELFLSGTDVCAIEQGAERARLAAEHESRLGTSVRYRHSIFIPEDGSCFAVYEAASVDVVRDAGLSFDRVTEAVEA